ncbi:uncharacterized protein AB675_6262 [Cyphellophora attinorum]|uniref:Mid2 domain-containing protein n=1 Tax=Cyphellophora attinorum TaxID=1664694 RepID=A0A0N0NQF3_9EURO|nr:uncharacterized protein AB675_6262 [Phialophora attinorum]KPI43841.1 hypothetical protein AB675_6262 [Phialophora attinorum]
MERPLKRLRIEDPDIRSPRDTGSRMAEGLFTSEMGIQSDDTDGHPAATPAPTAQLNLYQRRAIFGDGLQAHPLPHLQKRTDATITVAASQVVVNVNDGTSTFLATTIPTASTDSILSLSDLGSVTIPGDLTSIPTLTQTESSINNGTTSGVGSSSSSSTSSSTPSISEISSTSLNGTITSSTNIVTVTTTSTLEISYINGTLFPVVLATVSDDSGTTDVEPTNTAFGIGVSSDDSSTATAAATGDNGGAIVGATATSEAPAATSSSSGGGGGGGPSLSPQQQEVVGGVVGSIAGVAVILVFILFLLRRRRMKLKAQGRLPEQLAERNMLEGGNDGPQRMSGRSSVIPLTATLASSLRKLRPYSSHTQATDLTASTVPESERGFQKIAGRKIAPVLSTGGDGFGGDYGAFSKEAGGSAAGHQRNESNLTGSSFYRDSRGFYGGRGTDTPTYPPSPTIGSGEEKPGPSSTRDFAASGPRTPSQVSVGQPEGMAALRPSPARTPVTISPAPSSIRLPIQQTPDMQMLRRCRHWLMVCLFRTALDVHLRAVMAAV